MHMNKLGVIDSTLISAAASAFLSPDGGGGGGGGGGVPGQPPSNITVSPQIATQVSPQISPVFQQSFQPKNSPMTAGTQQIAPSNQSSYPGEAGNLPGDPILPGANLPPVYPPSPIDFNRIRQQSTRDYGLWIALGLGGVALIMLLGNKKARDVVTFKSRRRKTKKPKRSRKAKRAKLRHGGK